MMLEIDGWKVGLKFSASHFIPSHHKCSRIHGHDYGVRVRIFGEVEGGILYDFVDLKREVRSICDELDHRLLLPRDTRYIEHKIIGDTVEVSFEGKKYAFPRDEIAFLDIPIVTAEELAIYFSKLILNRINFPENVKGIEVCVDEGPGQGACHYVGVNL